MRIDKGFTLLEMMVVIAIIAITSSIAIPNMFSFVAGMRLRSASRDMFTTFQNTRMKAIRQSSRWAVQFNGTTSFQVIDCGVDNTCGTADDNVKIETKMLQYPSISMNQNFNGSRVVFSADGSSDNTGPVTFRKITSSFQCNKDQVCAVVSFTGGIRLAQGGEIRDGVDICPCN